MNNDIPKNGSAATNSGAEPPQSKIPPLKANRRQPPKARDCRIYEKHVLDGQTQEAVAARYKISRQRVAQIAAKVEGWIIAHPDHPLAEKMRVRLTHRWETLWAETMAGYDRSRENREVVTERTSRSTRPGNEAAMTVVTERTIRKHYGDVRFLYVGARVTERQQRLWPQAETDGAEDASHEGNGQPFYMNGALVRFPFLPGGLSDLADLARGVSSDPEVNVPVLFEQRCADAFRSLGFVVRQLGQGCGRVADCLALAPADRFGVILDAKVRRDGYTLGTDDRQFCEYAARHSEELSQSGIDRVYFVVIGAGFRQHDLDNLANLMAAAPIRSVCFLEAHALMRLLDDSIHHRSTFRLAALDRLFFGNKIIGSG